MSYTKQAQKYIDSVDGKAHMSAVEIIERLERAIQKTLTENAHLADGENCTLKELKKVMDII